MTSQRTMINRLRKVTLADPDDERQRFVLTQRWSITGKLDKSQWATVRKLYRPWDKRAAKRAAEKYDLELLKSSPL